MVVQEQTPSKAGNGDENTVPLTCTMTLGNSKLERTALANSGLADVSSGIPGVVRSERRALAPFRERLGTSGA